MESNQLFAGDVGAVISIEVIDLATGNPLDISGATVKKLYFTKPLGAKVNKTAEFTTDGTDGKIEYTTIAGDLDTAGTWHVQGYVEIPGRKFYTEINTMEVLDNLV